MTAIMVRVRPYGLVPVSGWDAQQAKYPVDSTLHITIAKGRSAKMQRFYWALVNMVADAIGYDKEVLSDELLTRTRRIDSYQFINGDIHIQPKRISKMRHDDFKSYVDDAIALICADYIAEMTRSRLLLEVENMLGITYEDAFAPPRRKKNDSASSGEGLAFQSEG